MVGVEAVARGRVCERVARLKSSKRRRSTTVRHVRSAAASGGRRDRRAPRAYASISSGVWAERPSARCDSDRPSAPTHLHRPRIPIVRERVEVAAHSPPEDRHERAPRRAARPRRRSRCHDRGACAAVFGPTPHSRLDRERVQELELAVGRHDQQTVGLGDAARDLGEELGASDADRDREADPLEHVVSQPDGDLGGRSRHAAAARRRRGTPRRSTGPRRAGSCRRRPRTPPCSPPSTPTCAGRRRPRAGTAGGLAARPSRCGHRTPWPRSSRRAPRPRRRSPAGRAGAGRRAARPTRRRHRGRRAGSWLLAARTHVRIRLRRRPGRLATAVVL